MSITNGEPYTWRQVRTVLREGKRNLQFKGLKGALTLPYDLLQSHTARTMLANSEFLIMLNQAATDRQELAKLINMSQEQANYITDVEAGSGLIKVGSAVVPFENKFPKDTKLYRLMTTKPYEKFH